MQLRLKIFLMACLPYVVFGGILFAVMYCASSQNNLNKEQEKHEKK